MVFGACSFSNKRESTINDLLMTFMCYLILGESWRLIEIYRSISAYFQQQNVKHSSGNDRKDDLVQMRYFIWTQLYLYYILIGIFVLNPSSSSQFILRLLVISTVIPTNYKLCFLVVPIFTVFACVRGKTQDIQKLVLTGREDGVKRELLVPSLVPFI